MTNSYFFDSKLDGETTVTVVLDADNFPKYFRMFRISHAKNQLRGHHSFRDLLPDSSLKMTGFYKKHVNFGISTFCQTTGFQKVGSEQLISELRSRAEAWLFGVNFSSPIDWYA